MKWKLVLPFVLAVTSCFAQEAVIMDTSMFEKDFQSVKLSKLDGWWFRQGNDEQWAAPDVDLSGWKKMKPTEATLAMANDEGRFEGWFRFKFRLDSSFKDLQLGLREGTRGASELYIDGVKIGSYGNDGNSLDTFIEYHPDATLPQQVSLQIDIDHVLSIHFVDYRTDYPPYKLRSEGYSDLSQLVALTGPRYPKQLMDILSKAGLLVGIVMSIGVLLSLMFWMLALQNREEGSITLAALFQTMFTIALFFGISMFDTPELTSKQVAIAGYLRAFFSTVAMIILMYLLLKTLKRTIPNFLKIAFVVGLIDSTITLRFFPEYQINNYLFVFFPPLIIYYLVTSWRSLKGAQWAIVWGLIAFFLLVCYYVFATTVGSGLPDLLFFLPVVALTFPLALVVFIVMRFKEMLLEVKANANEIVQLSEEKKTNAVRQQEILEKEVARQTLEIRTTLTELKATQSQLIQQEKMASLGELTAGIAHEIQNPLNFVNNFSEVNVELVQELKTELAAGKIDAAIAIARDIEENEQKIKQHGKRADGIVKGMLQHSRKSTGQKEPTDINALCDEFFKLSYHGLRAKDKSFNAVLKTDFQKDLPKVSVVAQDMERVILNVINNAFYAVNERKRMKGAEEYEPAVTVKTRKVDDKVEIRIADNGTGIPENVRAKIFQPFFTTKPTGQGTGLGLSLAYDIITKGHGGTLSLESLEGQGSTFTITLPIAPK